MGTITPELPVPVPVAIISGGAGGGPVTIADGADVAEGATTDVAVISDSNGTISGKLRGLVKILSDIWDSVNHRIRVDGSGVTQPVSGTISVTNFPTVQVVDASQAPITLADLEGNQASITNDSLNVHLKTAEALNLDGLGNLGVNVQGLVPVSVGPITVSSQSLSPNAAQESNGNLASIAVTNLSVPPIVDLLTQILAQLKTLNVNFAAATNNSLDDPDIAAREFIQ